MRHMQHDESENIYRLKNIGLPAIRVLNDLATATRLSPEFLKIISGRSKRFYKTYEIEKKSGGRRIISQPSRELKAIQGWILRNILDKLSVSPYSKGFEKNTSILDNAYPHIGANYILSLDIEDFFPSIHASHVYNIYRSVGYSKNISRIFTNLSVYDGGLPQGAPTSPKLANLICSKLDARVSGYAGPKGITYTRYADDLTLSAQTAKKILKAHDFIKFILKDEGLTVNDKKTCIQGPRKKKIVTGLVVTEKSVGVGREQLRIIRAKIHHLFTGENSDIAHVNGLISYLYGVDKKSYRKTIQYIDKLIQKFGCSPQDLISSKERIVKSKKSNSIQKKKNVKPVISIGDA